MLVFGFSLPACANYIVIDEVIENRVFSDQVETMGNELASKTGIHLYMSLIKVLEDNRSIIDYQKELMKSLQQPAVLLSFVEQNRQVQIYAEDKSLYETFDKDQIMSPFAIWPFFDGAIIPILGVKSKEAHPKDKYATAMFNGYAEISEQIAGSKDIVLDSAVGNANKNVFRVLISVLFLISVYTVIKLSYDYRKRKREDNESV